MSGFVYVIEAQIGLIKIGCAASPESRLATVRCHSPVLARLIAKWPGTLCDEHRLHRRFRAQRSHSEWFRIEGALLSFVAEISGRGLEAIEPWSEISFATREERRASGAEKRQRAMRAMWSDPAFRLEQIIAMQQGREVRRLLGPWQIGPVDPARRSAQREIEARVRAEIEAKEASRTASPQPEAA